MWSFDLKKNSFERLLWMRRGLASNQGVSQDLAPVINKTLHATALWTHLSQKICTKSGLIFQQCCRNSKSLSTQLKAHATEAVLEVKTRPAVGQTCWRKYRSIFWVPALIDVFAPGDSVCFKGWCCEEGDLQLREETRTDDSSGRSSKYNNVFMIALFCL